MLKISKKYIWSLSKSESVIFSLIILLLLLGVGRSQLLITEFMASNNGRILDNYGDSSDWIEIYNAHNYSVDLGDYYMTDDKGIELKFKMPEFILAEGSFYVIWASGNYFQPVKLPSDLDIKFTSAGTVDGNIAAIFINGEQKSLDRRGINVVVVDPDGINCQTRSFDTYFSKEESDSLVQFLHQIQSGQIVVFSVKDEASNALSEEARNVIEAMGSRAISKLEYRDSWGMIAIKNVGVVQESYRKMGDGATSSNIPPVHANFKLDAGGEYIGIYTKRKSVIDSISFSSQITDRSFGRIPTVTDRWVFFSEPTPGLVNSISDIRFGQAPPPLLIPDKGYYPEPITVTILRPSENCHIYYTLDGSEPDSNSILYDNRGIFIEKPTVIRACCAKDNYFNSEIVSRIFVIKPQKSLNILSIVTSPDNLWDPDYGIYVVGNNPAEPNYGEKGERWERPALYCLMDSEGIDLVQAECSLRIHGGISRYIPKKSFRVYFEEPLQYYPNTVNKKAPPKQDVLILDGGGNDSVADPRAMGRNWSLIRDHLMMELYSRMGYSQTNKYPVALYLNGEYWGIYTIGERINNQFFENQVGIKNVDLIKDNVIAELGTLDFWHETIQFFKSSDFEYDQNYQIASSLINVENFTDYYILNLLSANWDWPTNNIYNYREIRKGTKWNWLVWDADICFGPSAEFNLVDKMISTEEGNEVFYNLIESDKFREYFVNRICYRLNEELHKNRLNAVLDSLVFLIEPEIKHESERWGESEYQWNENIRKMENFIQERPARFLENVDKAFKLGGLAHIKILNKHCDNGTIKINGYKVNKFPHDGVYYANLPIKFACEPHEGYIFRSWGSGQDSSEFISHLSKGDTLFLKVEIVEIESFRKLNGEFSIQAVYPNPFTAHIYINLFSIVEEEIEIQIYNIQGQCVTALKKKIRMGSNIIEWDATNRLGNLMPSGVYFIVIENIKLKVTLIR